MKDKRLRVLCLPGKAFRGGNPYFRMFCEGLETNDVETVEIKSVSALLGRFDIVHIHFPEHYVTEQSLPNAFKWAGFYLLFLLRAKIFGRLIVWSVHDVHPFKERHLWLLHPYMRVIHALVDAHIFMTPSSAAEFLRDFPKAGRKPRCEIPHGAYSVSNISQDVVDVERIRLRDDRNTVIVGFLGDIKEYKNVGALKYIPTRLDDGRKVKVLLAGKADKYTEEEVRDVVSMLGDDHATWRNERLSDRDLDLLIRSVDFVLLPYKKGWNSGLATLVLCNHGRVIGSQLGVFTDIATKYGRPWAYQYQTPQGIARAVNEAAADHVSDADKTALDEKLQTISFSATATDLVAFYKSLLRRTAAHGLVRVIPRSR